MTYIERAKEAQEAKEREQENLARSVSLAALRERTVRDRLEIEGEVEDGNEEVDA